MMKKIISFLALILAITKLPAQSPDNTFPIENVKSNSGIISQKDAEGIVERYIIAVGGAAAFDSLQSVIKTGTQNYFGNVESITFTYEKNKLSRLDAEYKGQKGYWMVSKAEGGEYFPWETKKPVKFSKAYLQSLQGNLNPQDILLNYKKDSSELTLMGKDTINQNVCYRIKLISKKRRVVRIYWIDEATYMVQRMEKYYYLRNKSLDKLKAVDRFDFSDYRLVRNIKLAHAEKFKTFINKIVVGEKTTLFSKIEINQAVNPMLYQITPGMEVTSSDYELSISEF